jgi:cell division protein FtsL
VKIYGNNQNKIKKILQKEKDLKNKIHRKEEKKIEKIGFVIFAIIITVVVMMHRYDLLFG